MAAAFWLKSRMVVPTFSVRLVLKTFCVATASVKKASTDFQARKKEKKKDLAKMGEYEEYRFGVQRSREAFKEEYNAKIAKERRRLEEINRGSYSPYEQHKKAVQDMMKYNEEKSTMRFVQTVVRLSNYNVFPKFTPPRSKHPNYKIRATRVLSLLISSKCKTS